MDNDTLQHMAQERLTELCLRYGIQPPTLSFDLTGRAAGMAYYPQNHIRLNLALMRANTTAFLDMVVSHELCHIWKGQLRLPGPPHGANWRALMQKMGVPATRTHHFDLTGIPVRRQRRWAYRCACRDHEISTVIHNRIRRGQAYLCRRCGRALAFVGAPTAQPD